MKLLLLFPYLYFIISSYESYASYESQVHLAQGKTPNHMTVSWVTNEKSDSTVLYGTEFNELKYKSIGYSTSYKFNNYESGIIHHTLLSNLIESTQYYYKCGYFNSDILNFTTMSKIGDTKEVTIGIIGDLGQTSDSKSTLQHLRDNHNISIILHAGDLSYANCEQSLWDSYGNLIEPLSQRLPWMVCPGNHEIEYTNNNSLYLAFEKRYKMPSLHSW